MPGSVCAHRCLSSLLWSLFAVSELWVTDDTHTPCYLVGMEAPGVDSGLGVRVSNVPRFTGHICIAVCQ